MKQKLKKVLYRIYLNLPFTGFIFRIIRTMTVPKYAIRRLLRFKGVFEIQFSDAVSVKMKSYGNTIENELFWNGATGWEPNSLELWRKLCRTSKSILDIGGNTGLYTLLAYKENPKAAIVVFEPIDFIYTRLVDNLSLNSVAAKPLKIALSDEDGEGKIYVAKTISDTFDQASLNKAKYQDKNITEISILKRKLETVIINERITSIDLMKIDVESFEPQVLKGMGVYLNEFRPTILIEILNDQIAQDVETIVQGMDYHFFYIDESKGLSKVDHLLPLGKGKNFLLHNPAKHELEI